MSDVQQSVRDEIREKQPTAALRAARGQKVAVRLFCIECFGGHPKEAVRCPEVDCFLWPLWQYRIRIAPTEALTRLKRIQERLGPLGGTEDAPSDAARSRAPEHASRGPGR